MYLWIPEHSMQSVMPRLMEAHDGSAAPQSQQRSLPVIDRSISTRLQQSSNQQINKPFDQPTNPMNQLNIDRWPTC